MNMIKPLILLALAAVANIACAGETEDAIKVNVGGFFGAPIESVSKAPFADLYEVVTQQGIAYTDKTGSFVIFGGTVIDAKSKANLTAKRMNELGAFKFGELPLADAVKIVHGNGKRAMATFEDPNCGYCKKLAHELDKLQDVTIYTFLYPVLGDDSTAKSSDIWCAKDRSASWVGLIRDGVNPPHVECDKAVIERNLALGKKLRVIGTPGILFASGERIPGYAAAADIDTKLSK